MEFYSSIYTKKVVLNTNHFSVECNEQKLGNQRAFFPQKKVCMTLKVVSGTNPKKKKKSSAFIRIIPQKSEFWTHQISYFRR